MPLHLQHAIAGATPTPYSPSNEVSQAVAGIWAQVGPVVSPGDPNQKWSSIQGGVFGGKGGGIRGGIKGRGGEGGA